jgi:hypothetical protein
VPHTCLTTNSKVITTGKCRLRGVLISYSNLYRRHSKCIDPVHLISTPSIFCHAREEPASSFNSNPFRFTLQHKYVDADELEYYKAHFRELLGSGDP